MSLDVKIEIQKTAVTVVLVGLLDQNAKLPLLDLQDVQTIIFDFKGIEGINSYGIRQWLKFMRHVSAAGVKCVFRNCRPQIVDQINMVQGFCNETTEIESFYAIYCNSKCKKDCEIEVRVDGRQALREGLPNLVCQECAQTMKPEQELDQFLDLIDRLNKH